MTTEKNLGLTDIADNGCQISPKLQCFFMNWLSPYLVRAPLLLLKCKQATYVLEGALQQPPSPGIHP